MPKDKKIKEEKKPVKKKTGHLDLLETDLIKDQVPVKFEFKRHLMAFFILLLVSFVILAELFLLLTWWGDAKKDESEAYLKNELNYIIGEKEKVMTDYNKVLEFKEDAKVSFAVLNNHVYWGNFFNYLEKNTLKDVYYRYFLGNLSGMYNLPSVTNDVRAISYQIKSFAGDDNTLDITTSEETIGSSGMSSSGGVINFNLNLNSSPRLFKK
jgi:hypothetical protein